MQVKVVYSKYVTHNDLEKLRRADPMRACICCGVRRTGGDPPPTWTCGAVVSRRPDSSSCLWAQKRTFTELLCSRNVEVRAELPDGVVRGIKGGNGDLVLERRGDGRDVEFEISGPVLTSYTSRRGAVSVVVAVTGARIVHRVDFDTHKHTCEVDFSQSGHCDIPNSVDVELLGVIFDHRVGVSVCAAIDHSEVVES